MEDEQFIMSSVERAREWIEAFSKTTKTGVGESASVLAALCRFGSWDVMANAIESLPPTVCDEAVGEDARSERFGSYMHVFVCMLDFMPPIAALFIKRLSPSANYPFKEFKIDEALHEIVDELEQVISEDGEQITDGYLDSETDPIRMLTAIRMAGKIDLPAWLAGLESIGWTIELESIDYEADVGEPSFIVSDDKIGQVPVYLSSLIRIPEDYSDPAINLFMKACLGDFIQEIDLGAETDSMLILWRWPLLREVAGHHYCCIGVRYSIEAGGWQDILVSEACNSPSRLFELNDQGPINDVGITWQCKALIDEDRQLSGFMAVLLSGYSPEHQPSVGWSILAEEIEDTGWARLSVDVSPKGTLH